MNYKKNYAIKLEYAFGQAVSADEFSINFQDALKSGLRYLCEQGYISFCQMNCLLEGYSAIKNLDNITEDENKKELLEKLISYANAARKNK